MATHSSILVWRIPGTREPGGLPSMGSRRVRHDWSDLAAAAAGLQLLKKEILSESQGWPGAQERWLGPQKTSERSGRGFSRPLMRSSGSWDSTEEPGITEVSVLPMVTSLSSCRRCWRISCDKEKLLPSAGSGMRRGMCRGVKASHTPTPAHPEDLLGVSSNPPSATSSPPLAIGTGVSWNPRASSGFRDKRILPSYF